MGKGRVVAEQVNQSKIETTLSKNLSTFFSNFYGFLSVFWVVVLVAVLGLEVVVDPLGAFVTGFEATFLPMMAATSYFLYFFTPG